MKPVSDERGQTQDVQAFAEHFSSTRLQRLANITLNHLGLTAPDVTVERREDGRVALVLPEAWAHLFLAHLTLQAEQIHERLRQAMWKARMKDARLQAELQRAAKEWEAQQERIYERYKVLTGQGMSHRDAIRQVKAESHGDLTASVVQVIVEGADPSERRARRERDERIRRKMEHLSPKEIARQERMTLNQIKWALRKGRPPSRTRTPKAALKEQRDLILALCEKGQTVKEIAAALGVKRGCVYSALRTAGMRLRGRRTGDAKANGS